MDTFTVEERVRQDGSWYEWKPLESGLSPRAAKTRMVRHAAYLAQGVWEVVGVNRTEITLESDPHTRIVVHMRKEN